MGKILAQMSGGIAMHPLNPWVIAFGSSNGD